MRWIGLVILWVWALNAFCATYSNFIENGGWSTESSRLRCLLRHTIPYYGQALFTRDAGMPTAFALRPIAPTLKTGQAAVSAQPPVWKQSDSTRSLGQVKISHLTPQETEARANQADYMLNELFAGQEVIFRRPLQNGRNENAQVAITPIGFRAAYRDYQTCLGQLLPASFEQIQRTSLYFGSAQHEPLTPSEQRKLDLILAYIKEDPSVKEFYIDGHTDTVDSEDSNLKLAEKRAMTVANYLIKGGVPKDALWVRWHGERFPVTDNTSRQGRAQNRRVTLRLENEAGIKAAKEAAEKEAAAKEAEARAKEAKEAEARAQAAAAEAAAAAANPAPPPAASAAAPPAAAPAAAASAPKTP